MGNIQMTKSQVIIGSFFETEIRRKIQCDLLSDPTPDGVALLDGIPKFLPYNAVEGEFYTAIGADVWTTESDYTLTYTVTADALSSVTILLHERANTQS